MGSTLTASFIPEDHIVTITTTITHTNILAWKLANRMTASKTTSGSSATSSDWSSGNSQLISGFSSGNKSNTKLALAIGLSVGLGCALLLILVILYFLVYKKVLCSPSEKEYDENDYENSDFGYQKTEIFRAEPERDYFARVGNVPQPAWVTTPTSAVRSWFHRRSDNVELDKIDNSPQVMLKKFKLGEHAASESSSSLASSEKIKPQLIRASPAVLPPTLGRVPREHHSEKPLPPVPGIALRGLERPQLLPKDIYRVQRAYGRIRSDEMGLKIGEHVTILKRHKDGWMYAEKVEPYGSTWKLNGERGMIPAMAVGASLER
ncbi:unnamed protein product [Kuraishia capsulata CBS 1993]|uniref:SH3 domain-containing protein n=1 Tax=Kuraishia capsulata CBS 1993 TaxID=1382522 RepID=W6MKI2_9ASCO|nr:uncharacterized protein KUCA_T00002855001 [Kuraishia capsulata CBS 1993]CDK26881.1 unnamed protein product [Kuraishia capsulata CBS 1993]